MFGKRLQNKQTTSFGRGPLIAVPIRRYLNRYCISNNATTMADFIQTLDPSKLVSFGAVRTAICRVMSTRSATSTRFSRP